MRISVVACQCPRVRATIKDGIRQWEDDGVLAEGSESTDLGCRVLFLVAAQNFKASYSGEGKVAKLAKIRSSAPLHDNVPLF